MYSCDKCEYATTKMIYLKRHVESQHEGVRYSCDKCDYAATSKSNLKRHIKTKHEGL